MRNLPEDYELLSFFEVEPVVLDKDIPWHYNILTFRTEKNNEKLTVHISPAYGDFEIYWELDDELRLHWKLYNIEAIMIEKKDDKEYMRIVMKDENIDDCLFFMKPKFKLLGGMNIVN